MTYEFVETIFSRRSIRKYTKEPVSESDIKTLLEAAMAAPSSSNRKPWHFVVVTERETLSRLAEAHKYARAAGIRVFHNASGSRTARPRPRIYS